MATEADQLTIQSLQNIVRGLRGATDINVQGEQARFGAQVQQQGQQRRQDFVQAQAQASQAFTQSRDEAAVEARQNAALAAQTANSVSQELAHKNRAILQEDEQKFRAEQNALKGPSVAQQRLNAKTSAESQAQRTNEAINTLAKHGGMTVNAAGQKVLVPKELTKSSTQSKIIKDNVIEIELMTDEEFEANKAGENLRANTLKKEMAKAGFPTAFADIGAIKDGETKHQYLTRLKGFRKSLISREIKLQMDRFDKTARESFGLGMGQPAARKAKLKTVTKEVTADFGGK